MAAPSTDPHRSILFIPADAHHYLARAAQRGADAIVLDLEDGVAPTSKPLARQGLTEAVGLLHASGCFVYVRVNHQPLLLVQDITAAIDAQADALIIPKVDTATQMTRIDATVQGLLDAAGCSDRALPLLALIETAEGIVNAPAIARSSSRLQAMCFGSEDYSATLGIEPSPESLGWPAQALIVAATSAGLHPLGLPGSVANFTDLQAYRHLAQRAKAMGMRGATCIHPAQVEVLNEVFGATTEEIAAAQRILTAFEEGLHSGKGAVKLDGKMIDEPIAQRARQVLQRCVSSSTNDLGTGAQ